jgi:predicted acyltransferase
MANVIDSYPVPGRSVPELNSRVAEVNSFSLEANSLAPEAYSSVSEASSLLPDVNGPVPDSLQRLPVAETGAFGLYERLFSTNRFPSRRLASVDGFRAITLLLMIFVNNLWSLYKVPGWLGHAGETEDRLGLADTVAPAFLFIVGLSIPFALQARKVRGYSKKKTFLHILSRSLALLVMGVFQVNLDNYDRVLAVLPKPWWQIGITLAFFLIWLDYPATVSNKKKQFLRGLGIFLLTILAFLFRGKLDGHASWMEPDWYGTLGIIGWSYLIGASVYLFIGDRLGVFAGVFAGCVLFNIANMSGWLEFLNPVKSYVWLLDSGDLIAFTMAGIMTSGLYRQVTKEGQTEQGILVLATLVLILMGAGIALRPFWGISKERDTASWILICTAISIAAYIILLFLMDLKGKKSWIRSIRPASTSTLTCYLLPYIHNAVLNLFGSSYSLPLVLRTGSLGILKALLYAWVIIRIAGWLEKKGFRLAL